MTGNQIRGSNLSNGALGSSAKPGPRIAVRPVLHRPGMRILFITATRIGDAVLSTGLLDHLLHTYPDACFTIACGPVAEGVFARMPRRDATLN